MSNRCESKFTIESWEEKPNESWACGKLTRTLAVKKFTGPLEGTGTIEAVMLKYCEGDVDVKSYVGIETILGTLEGRTGSFVLVHVAEALRSEYSQTLKILPGSGTGELAGISGSGSISPSHEFVLEYELADQSG